MTSTIPRGLRAVIRVLLIERLGDRVDQDGVVTHIAKCGVCGERENENNPLEFDHIDGNPNNTGANYSNLRLVHHKCNVKAYHQKLKDRVKER